MLSNPTRWAELLLILAVGAFASIFTLAALNGAPPELATLQGTVALTGVGVLGWLGLRLGEALPQQEQEPPDSPPSGVATPRQTAGTQDE